MNIIAHSKTLLLFTKSKLITVAIILSLTSSAYPQTHSKNDKLPSSLEYFEQKDETSAGATETGDKLKTANTFFSVGNLVSDESFTTENSFVKFTKTVNNTGSKKGDVLNYTLLAKNIGAEILHDIYIVDENADYGSVFPAKVDFILPGATAVFMVKRTLKQEDIDKGFFSNQAVFFAKDSKGATVKQLSDDPRTELANDPTITFFTLTADLLTVTNLKDQNQKNYIPGDEVPYTITIKNNGPNIAKDVSVVNLAPEGTTISKWKATSVGCILPNTNGAGDLNQLIPELPVNATVQYEVVVLTANGKTDPQEVGKSLSNTVAVTSKTLDLTSMGDVLSTPPINAIISNDLSIVKTSNQLTVVGRDTPFDYTITVKNNGYFTATSVLVNDVMPSDLNYVSHNITTGKAIFDVSRNSLVWNVGNISAGETITLKLTVKAKNAGVISSTATVAASEFDPVLANNTSTVNNEIFALAGRPNIITPNGDGKNDRFVIDGLELYPQNTLNIFNRWGNEVYRSVGNYNNDWDGNNLKGGTYYYVLKIKDAKGNWLATNGFITLLKNG